MSQDIIKTKGVSYKIMMYLFEHPNNERHNGTVISRNTNVNGMDNFWKNVSRLVEIKLLTVKKVGRCKYLDLTNKGRVIALKMFELERALR